MPAASQVQQQAAGAELSRRRRGKRRQKFKSMSTADLRDYARTKHKGLPKRRGPRKRRKARRTKKRGRR